MNDDSDEIDRCAWCGAVCTPTDVHVRLGLFGSPTGTDGLRLVAACCPDHYALLARRYAA